MEYIIYEFFKHVCHNGGGMRYKDAKLTHDEKLRWGMAPIALSCLIGCLLGWEGIVVGLIIGAIIALLLIGYKSGCKYKQAERNFLDKLKAKGITPKIERIVLPRNAEGAVIVYVSGYDGEFWRYLGRYGEYITSGKVINNEVVLTYEHRNENGVYGYDTIRTLNVYKEVVSETH